MRDVERIAGFDELLTNALQANVAQITMRDNQDMRRISAWVAIIAVPTMVFGLYGMNFEHMPELEWTYGYPAVVAAVLVICAALYRKFKRTGWLGASQRLDRGRRLARAAVGRRAPRPRRVDARAQPVRERRRDVGERSAAVRRATHQARHHAAAPREDGELVGSRSRTSPPVGETFIADTWRTGERIGELESIAVAPSHRGRGSGARCSTPSIASSRRSGSPT